jgi:hypothetical protein
MTETQKQKDRFDDLADGIVRALGEFAVAHFVVALRGERATQAEDVEFYRTMRALTDAIASALRQVGGSGTT